MLARDLSSWLDPPWRRERASERAAWAWATVGVALASYLLICLLMGPQIPAMLPTLYLVPCVLGGLAFGAAGGLVVSLLAAPLHGVLVSARVVELAGGAMQLVAALAVLAGVCAGCLRELVERRPSITRATSPRAR